MTSKHKYYIQGAFWIVIYLAITLTPLFVMLLGDVPPARGFWREFSVALGFCGLAMMGLQFTLTARFRRVKAPFGSDIVYYFHRQISLATFVLILAHPLILFITSPDTIKLLNFFTAPWRARAAVAAFIAMFLVIGTSLWRKRLRINYDHWRIAHGFLAIASVVFTLLHIIGVNHYVSSPWKRTLWIIYGCLWIGLLVYVRLVKPWVELRKSYQVVSVKRERNNAWTLVLAPKDHRGLRFKSGQFAWLTLFASPFHDKEHPFSFSSSAEHPEELSFTIKELGDFSSTVKDALPGMVAYLDGPHGSFSYERHPNAPGYIFIAGGVGITPMMSMLRTMADRLEKHELYLFYANKNWDAIIFRDEIVTLGDLLNLKIIHILQNPPQDWSGETGFINEKILSKHLPNQYEEYHFYICGPQPMMDSVEKSLQELGVPGGNYHSERFDLV